MSGPRIQKAWLGGEPTRRSSVPSRVEVARRERVAEARVGVAVREGAGRDARRRVDREDRDGAHVR